MRPKKRNIRHLHHALASLLLLIVSVHGQSGVHGITEPLRQATISAPFAAKIVSIKHDEGDFVRAGDTIMALDYEEARLEVKRSRVIAENEAELTSARLKAETAKIDLDATSMLFDSTRSVSEEELWKKRLESNLANAEYDRLVMTKKKEHLEHEIARARLARHFIIAPYNGVVAARYLDLEESCKPQEPLVKFVDVHKCRFIGYVPMARSRGLARGKQVTLSLNGGDETLRRTGTVEFVSPVVDPSSSLRTVKVVFKNGDGSVAPGIGGSLALPSAQSAGGGQRPMEESKAR